MHLQSRLSSLKTTAVPFIAGGQMTPGTGLSRICPNEPRKDIVIAGHRISGPIGDDARYFFCSRPPEVEMSSQAIVDVASIRTSEDLRQALLFAGVEDSESNAEELLAIFRSTESPASDAPESANEVGIWTGARNDRHHNPFGRNAYHVLGASPSLDPEMVRSTVEHLQTGAHMHLTDLLGANCAISRQEANHSREKDALIKSLDAFCGDKEVRAHVVDSLAEALDELITNAMYNAPAEAGEPGRGHMARTIPVASRRPVIVEVAADDEHVGIAVSDEYGSLTPQKVIDNLSRCYQQPLASISQKRGGAGLGLFMLLQGATRLVINITPERYTEFVLLRRKNESRRAFARSAPTLNICTGGAQ